MGKETRCIMRPILSGVKFVYNYQNTDLQEEVTSKWNISEVLSQQQIVEDGKILITIINDNTEDRFFCTGFTQTGNKFFNLISTLKKKRLIPRGRKVKAVFLDKEFVDVRVNVESDYFSIGDRIILLIEQRTRNPIKKPTKRREKRRRN